MADLGTAVALPPPPLGILNAVYNTPVIGTSYGTAVILPPPTMLSTTMSAYAIAGTLECPACPPPPGPPTNGQVWPLTYVQG